MTSSPIVTPTMYENVEFLERYIDCVETLPLEVQLYITRLRENDVIYQENLLKLSDYVASYKHSKPLGINKQKILTKIQSCLLKIQHCGDEKLTVMSQIVDLIEQRSQAVSKFAVEDNNEQREQIKLPNVGAVNAKAKFDKTPKVQNNNEKLTPKQCYEKPKRNRRSRALEKPEKSERSTKSTIKDEIKEEEMEQEEIAYDEDSNLSENRVSETKTKNGLRKKDKANKIKDEKDDKKDERKVKEKYTAGKVTKKSKVTTKLKKKKKKEKEETPAEIPIDPDEPTYCICNSISYGDMIGCDHEECEIEWFHFGCVNLTHKPKGKWYCPGCTTERKEKGKK